MYAQQLFISIFVILSTAGQYYSITPKIVMLANEPIEFTTDVEELKHLSRMKKAVDEKLEKEEKEAKSDDFEKDNIGTGENFLGDAPANKSSTQTDGKPSDKDELGFPLYNDQAKSQTGDLMYQDDMKKAEEETKKKEASLQAREESNNSTSDDTSNSFASNSTNDKVNNESIHKVENATHPSDRSTVAPVTQSTSKIIDTLKSSTSPKEIRNENHNNGTHPSSAASAYLPTIFCLFISFVIICFIFLIAPIEI